MRYFPKFKNRVSAYAEKKGMRAAIATLNRTQFRRLQFDKSGAEAEDATGVRARAVAVVAEHARVADVVAAATAEEQAFA